MKYVRTVNNTQGSKLAVGGHAYHKDNWTHAEVGVHH